MNLNQQIIELDAHIASVTFNSTEGELKAQLLIAKAGMLQAEAIRQLTGAIRVSHLDSLRPAGE